MLPGDVDEVKLKLIGSMSATVVVAASSSSSLSRMSSEEVPVTPMYSDESSSSSLLVGCSVVSLYLSVDISSSPDIISFVMLSDCVESVINGVAETVLVSNVVSSADCVVVVASLGETLGTRIHESPESLLLVARLVTQMMINGDRDQSGIILPHSVQHVKRCGDLNNCARLRNNFASAKLAIRC